MAGCAAAPRLGAMVQKQIKKKWKTSEKKFKKTKKDVDTFLEEVYILIHRRNSKLRESKK